MTPAETTTDAEPTPHEPLSLRFRVVLGVVAVACLASVLYGNAHTEEYRLLYPRFRPWLWNLYLTCFVAGIAGSIAAFLMRRWGYWTLMGAGTLAVLISIYAMGITLAGLIMALSLGAIWVAAQPDWSKLG
ncbi:MAG: hypothetical protein AB7F89_26485 [Pirellulaceae bacterium]